METLWQETSEGYLFDTNGINSSAVLGCLEVLELSGQATKSDNGILVPYRIASKMSNDDAELLGMPEKNPYMMSLKSSGTIGYSDLHYAIDILQPNGQPFVNPRIIGNIVEIDSDRIYRMDTDQFDLAELARKSNNDVPGLPRNELLPYTYANIAAIQQSAQKSGSKLDSIIDETNADVIVLEGLDIEFVGQSDGNYKVEPVVISKNKDGKIESLDSKDFREKIQKRRPSSIIKTNDGKKYICNEQIRKGLEEIRGLPVLSSEEYKRYSKQPKELLVEDCFLHNRGDGQEDDYAKQWLQEEGIYSSRVSGIELMSSSQYQGITGGKGHNWTSVNGVDENDGAGQGGKKPKTNRGGNENGGNSGPKSGGPGGDNHHGVYVLDIKKNYDRIDYLKSHNSRTGTLSVDALKPGIKLLKHQEEGIRWIYDQWQEGYQGVLLADDMGLGKTVQALVFVAALKKAYKDSSIMQGPILIVCPTALKDNWVNEYDKFIVPEVFDGINILQGNKLLEYGTTERTPNGKKRINFNLISPNSISITTYETLRDYQFSFSEVNWSVIISDESQKIKNPGTGVTRAIKAMKYDFTICLSGTPVENSWIDLWSIMDYVQPAQLGSLADFKDYYIKELDDIETDRDSLEKLGHDLKDKLQPLFLRRMKKDYLDDIPRKNEYECKYAMPEYQLQVYRSIINSAKKGKAQPLKVIAGLRDVSLHPDLSTQSLEGFFKKSPDVIINQSARLIVLFDKLREIKKRNEKALVFLVSKKMQMVVRNLIKRKFGIDVSPPINGDINGRARQRLIDGFNGSDGFNVLILSPEAAGVGFTITSANNVIHLSRTWNPAKEDQATDRAYRIGQKKDVNVYIPMACHSSLGDGNSFDEKLNDLLKYKRVLSENVLYPTGDSVNDGLSIFKGVTDGVDGHDDSCYWTIGEIDDVTGNCFESIIAELYSMMEGCIVHHVGGSGDMGADVIVLKPSSKSGYIIQCKHRENPSKALEAQGVIEVFGAVNCYQDNPDYVGYKFDPVVVTNAYEYTSGAIEKAKYNNVKLINRLKLIELLDEYHVLKA